MRAVCSDTGSGNVEHALENGLPDVEHLDPMLREITDPHVVPERRARRFCTGRTPASKLEQGRFAGAVRPDEHGALAAFRFEIQ